MANAKPRTGGADSQPETSAPPPMSARSRRILAIVIAVLVAVGLGVAAFALWGTTSGMVASPTDSPGATPQGTQSPPATSPVPTPTDSPAVPDVTPINIENPGTITPGLTAKMTSVEAVDGIARGPGEVAGPSLRITVTITNATSKEASLRTAVISCYFGANRTPAQELREPGGSPLPASVAAGNAATGVYIFTVPPAERKNVTIMVDYSVDVSPLVFQGDVATIMNH